MKVKDIFIKKLKQAKYVQNKNAPAFDLDNPNFSEVLTELEKDRENVFKAIYGQGYIKNRGKKPMKEYLYRLLEAERDLKLNYILMTMHYLITQIKIGAVKL